MANDQNNNHPLVGPGGWTPDPVRGYIPPPPQRPQQFFFARGLTAAEFLRSTGYKAGESGWAIKGDGSAEFSDVTIRGTLETSDIKGDVTLKTGGRIRTAASGERLEILTAGASEVRFYSGSEHEVTDAYGLIRANSDEAEGVVFVDIISGGTAGDGRTVTQWNSAPTEGGRPNFNIFFGNSAGSEARSGDFYVHLDANGRARFLGDNDDVIVHIDDDGVQIEGDLVANLQAITGNTALFNTSSKAVGYQSSRRAHKQNIRNLEAGEANPVWQLKPRRFNWDESKVEGADLVNARCPDGVAGMIADEVAAVAPDAATWQGDEPVGLDTLPLIAYLVDAVQHLRRRVEELEAAA